MLYIEKTFDAESARIWFDSVKHVAPVSAVIYIILTFGVRSYMQNRPGYQLRGPLFCWNVALAVFSIIGTIRTVPIFVDVLSNEGWMYSICNSSVYTGAQTAVWVFAFVSSKLIELGDTAFIVLRKQQLTFLHVYHHVTVLLYCFYSYPEHASCGRWYMVFNYSIHSLMYSYFAFKSMKFRIPKVISVFITSMQIVQMMVGLVVSMNVMVLRYRGQECHQTLENAIAAVLMYFSYLLLFVHFFYRSYATPTSPKRLESNGELETKSVGNRRAKKLD